jgi:hypothetical protein
MRPHTMLSLLLPAALACSGSDPSPTELKPEFVTACTPPKPTVTASPTSVTKSPNTTGSTKFIVKNNCTSNVTDMTFTSSRTGAVTSVGAPSPAILNVLAPGASASVFVTYSVGASGSGMVVLTANSAGGVSTGSQAVTVTGVAFGVGQWNAPTDLVGSTLKWSGAVENGYAPTLRGMLAGLSSAKARVILSV